MSRLEPAGKLATCMAQGAQLGQARTLKRVVFARLVTLGCWCDCRMHLKRMQPLQGHAAHDTAAETRCLSVQ